MSYPVRYYYFSNGKRNGPFTIPSMTGFGNASASSALEARKLIDTRLPENIKNKFQATNDIQLQKSMSESKTAGKDIFYWTDTLLPNSYGGRKSRRKKSRRAKMSRGRKSRRARE